MPSYTIKYEGGDYPADGCKILLDVIKVILCDWVDREIDAKGTVEFLKARCHDFGITDADIDEGTYERLLKKMSTAAMKICTEGCEKEQ